MTLYALTTLLRIIWIHFFTTIFTSDLEILALFHAMKLHVFTDDSHTAPKLAWYELELAFRVMLECLFISACELTFRYRAFEFQRK